MNGHNSTRREGGKRDLVLAKMTIDYIPADGDNDFMPSSFTGTKNTLFVSPSIGNNFGLLFMLEHV